MTSNENDQSKALDQLKSIVYGDVVKNKHGAFRCFCATISDESQIGNIVNYLRKNVSFHRLNKFSYAYRISTQNDQVIENFNNDPRLEGCGEKILHLLQKFNVENVLLIIGMDKKDVFGILTTEHYHTIVERAKDLLSTLYEKVLENDFGRSQQGPFMTSIQEQSVTSSKKLLMAASVTRLDPNMIPPRQGVKKIDRPNHFMSFEQRQKAQSQKLILPPISDREQLLQSVLIEENNLKRNFDKIKSTLGDWQDNDYQHLKFVCLYDKMPLLAKVFKILMILDDVKSAEELSQTYDFKQRLPILATMLLTKEKCKKVSDMLRQEKLLTPKALARDNPVVASLLEYLILLVRNYELSERIFALANVKSHEKHTSYDLQYSKIGDDSEEVRRNIVMDLTKDLAYSLRDKQSSNQTSKTHVATLETEENVLHQASYTNDENQNIKVVEKDTTLQDQPQSMQRITPKKTSIYISKGITPALKQEKYKGKSESISISEELSHHMEPRLSNQVGNTVKTETGSNSKLPTKKPPKTKSQSILSEKNEPNKKQNLRSKGLATEGDSLGSNNNVSERDSKIKAPYHTPKQAGLTPSIPNQTPQELYDDGEGGFYDDDIPDEPDDIRQYLEENPIEGQTNHNLEAIAHKLQNHRAKGSN